MLAKWIKFDLGTHYQAFDRMCHAEVYEPGVIADKDILNPNIFFHTPASGFQI